MRLSMACLFLCTATAAQAPLPDRAHPLRVPVATTVDFGNEYSTAIELYDVKITVAELLRGQKALEFVEQASTSNQLPGAGFEYLLARIRFSFSARTAPGDHTYTLSPDQFTAMSSDGSEYPQLALARTPLPALSGVLKSGDTAEGWIPFLVPRNDPKPLMVFREEVGTVLRRGGGIFFRLY